MQFDHLNFNEGDGLMSIEDLRALRLRKKKIESDKKARKYILDINCLLYTSPSPRDLGKSRMPSSA